MALGRAETIFKETGQPVRIVNEIGATRDHAAWIGNPAVSKTARKTLLDCSSHRPYILHWKHRQAIYNLDHRPKAGKIYLTQQERDFNKIGGRYIVIAPTIKDNASINKNWGSDRWEKVIKSFGLPVYQLSESGDETIKGASPIKTPTFRLAASIISGATFVLTNEGGTHHMAASFGVPAVVIFGSFIPPEVTGYDFHINIHRKTPHGYCGKWDYCPDCNKALADITPEEVRAAAESLIAEKKRGSR